jgi:hypothetical protein
MAILSTKEAGIQRMIPYIIMDTKSSSTMLMNMRFKINRLMELTSSESIHGSMYRWEGFCPFSSVHKKARLKHEP